MGIRLFLIILALWFIFLIGRHFLRSTGKTAAKTINRKGVDMVQCIHCGVHLPKEEAIYDEPNFFCCEEHQRLG